MSSGDDATVASIRMKWFLGPIAMWVLALLTIFAFPRDIPEISGLAILLFPLTGLLLLVVFTVAVFRCKERRPAAVAIVLVTLIGVTYFAGGLQWGARLHLLINRSRYEATIARLSAARSREERETICGDDCMILSDEPLRVTFHFCHAFLYWPDIVHDSSGAVSDNDIARLHQPNVYLFGAKRLTGDWYLADFGD